MSSTGLNTNTFRITGKYLALLNNFVVKAKIYHEVEEGQKEHLIDFITKLLDENNTQPQFQLLSNIVERALRLNSIDFSQYLNSIINEIKEDRNQEFLPKIEFLVDVLDTENCEALSKIIGE